MSQISPREIWGGFTGILTNNDVAVKGQAAFLDTSSGLLAIGKQSTTLVYVGIFRDNLTGDGATKNCNVELDNEIALRWWTNDTVNAVVAAGVGSSCYVKDGTTVSSSTNGSTRSVAGRVLRVDSALGVLVQSGLANTGPTGASGSSLASGGVADRAALSAIAAGSRYDGQVMVVREDGSSWRFVAASVLATDESKMLAVKPDAGTGAWLRLDKAFTLKLPFTFSTADASVLLTVPSGFALKLGAHPYFEITTGMTGGSSSAIGVSTAAVTGYTTKGDLLGGASGDVAATLVAGKMAGTLGGKLDTVTRLQALLLKSGDVIRFDRITSAFTAGAGNICIPVFAATVA